MNRVLIVLRADAAARGVPVARLVTGALRKCRLIVQKLRVISSKTPLRWALARAEVHQSRVATYKQKVKHVHVFGVSGWTTLFRCLGAPPGHDTYIVP